MREIKINLKKEIRKLNAFSGRERGVDYNVYLKSIESRVGENGIKKLKKELKKYGFKIYDFKYFSNHDWIPAAYPYVLLLASTKIFKWNEKDLYNLGANCVLISPFLKIYLRYFLSTRKTIEKAVESWKMKSDTSTLELVEFNKQKRVTILRLKKFNIHPFICSFYAGAFAKVVEIATASKKIKTKETKCIHKGDKYHEFFINF